jgi:protein-S-isoprenylcysteine O-methyltransferase Ste14
VGTPPALGSLWGLLAVVGALPVLAARISDEERMLVEELPGYGEYMAKVRPRLVPGVW